MEKRTVKKRDKTYYSHKSVIASYTKIQGKLYLHLSFFKFSFEKYVVDSKSLLVIFWL